MTVEIDDSGTGDLIGPAFILFWRRETNSLLKKEVPLELYQDPHFNILSKDFIRDLFISAFKELDIPQTEDIYLCTGPCFDHARIWLKENEYNFHDAKIEGHLQDVVEQTYMHYIIENYNFPSEKSSLDSGKKRFFELFHWVAEDFPRREHWVKSGFEKWQTKWRAEAELEWMTKMVKNVENRDNSYLHHTPYSSRKQKPYRKPKSKKKSKKYSASSSKANQQNRKTSQPKNPRSQAKSHQNTSSRKNNPKYRKNSGSNRNPNRNPKYSATDPDPKQKFY